MNIDVNVNIRDQSGCGCVVDAGRLLIGRCEARCVPVCLFIQDGNRRLLFEVLFSPIFPRHDCRTPV